MLWTWEEHSPTPPTRLMTAKQIQDLRDYAEVLVQAGKADAAREVLSLIAARANQTATNWESLCSDHGVSPY